MELKDHLVAAGVSNTLLVKAHSVGLTVSGILGLVIRYGPLALQVLEDIIAEIEKVKNSAPPAQS